MHTYIRVHPYIHRGIAYINAYIRVHTCIHTYIHTNTHRSASHAYINRTSHTYIGAPHAYIHRASPTYLVPGGHEPDVRSTARGNSKFDVPLATSKMRSELRVK